MFGGVTSLETSARTNRLFQVWVEVPGLREMAWEALLASFPHLRRKGRGSLKALGVPPDLADTIPLPKGL